MRHGRSRTACAALATRAAPLLLAGAVVLATGLGASSARAQIYVGANSSGAVVLSNFSTEETPNLVVAAPEPVAVVVPSKVPEKIIEMPLPPDPRDRAAAFRSMIDKVAREVAMSPQLLHAVIRVES